MAFWSRFWLKGNKNTWLLRFSDKLFDVINDICFWRCKRLQLTQQIFKNELKSGQNKKGQIFFYLAALFFEYYLQLAAEKIFWPFLFCDGFIIPERLLIIVYSLLPTNCPNTRPKTINWCLTSILCVCFETRSLLEHRSFWDFWLELLFLWRLDIFVCEIVSLIRKFVALRRKCVVFSSLEGSCFGRDDLFFVELEDLMRKGKSN